jgi:hypothetical protein
VSTAIRQGLYQKLAATSAVTSKLATTTSIFHQQAPPNAAYPYIIFNKQAGTKRRAFSEPNAFKREVWMVKAIDRNTTSNLAESISEAVDAALDGGSITVTGKTLADLNHVGDIDYLEASGDQQYRHHGAQYAVTVT